MNDYYGDLLYTIETVIELEINKSPEECIKIIKSSIPSYYNLAENFMPNEYSCKTENGHIAVVGRQIGLPEIVLNIELVNDGVGTRLKGTFKPTLPWRFMAWAYFAIVLWFSISCVLGMANRKVAISDSPLTSIGVLLLPFISAIAYLIYTENGIKRKQAGVISLIKKTFAMDNDKQPE